MSNADALTMDNREQRMREVTQTKKGTPRPKLEWHLICVTRLGKVSILKDLDLFTAREAYKRLQPDTRPKKYNLGKCLRTGEEAGSFSHSYGWVSSFGKHDDWLEKVEAIGPSGLELDPWHGVQPRVIAAECDCGCQWDARIS